MEFVGKLRSVSCEFAYAIMFDKRCLKSIKSIAIAVCRNATKSFSAACGKTLRQCGTRIFSNIKMSVYKMLAGHYQETGRRATRFKTVLVAQDTTSFNFTGHKATKGLGNIATDERSKGIMCHTAIVIREDGLPLGIIDQKMWTRQEEERGKKHKRHALAFEEKESYKWVETLRNVQDRLPGKIDEIWVIADRESDVYEYMMAEHNHNVYLLVRACQPRQTEVEISGKKKRGKLMEIVKQLPVIGQKKVELNRGNKEIKVTLSVSCGNIKLFPPVNKPGLPPLEMSVVYAVEEAPDSEDRIEWILLCEKRDLSASEALNMVKYYSHRWKIERLHYTLKTGVYDVEKLRFDDAHTWRNALAFSSGIRNSTISCKRTERDVSTRSPANDLIDKDEKEVLEAYTGIKIKTARDVIKAIGTLGGFLGGSKRYPFPGVKTLWVGLITLIGMKQGWLLAKAQFKKR